MSDTFQTVSPPLTTSVSMSNLIPPASPPPTPTTQASFSITQTHLEQELHKKRRAFFCEQRHHPQPIIPKEIVEWRMKQRLKTVHVALVLCLNIGVDPPDLIKVQPCAKLECWIDPTSMQAQKALEAIGNELKLQYERWQPRARYKICLDPTVDDVKKNCCQLRRSAKKERILFHFNGHGVPKPTVNGEIWVFNKDFTQYIPLSIYDLNQWMESPSIYVFDCNAAGLILKTFLQLMSTTQDKGLKENIILASCGPNESLPTTSSQFPLDLFTSCLTTPIRVALRWFLRNNRLLDQVTDQMIENIPGRINDRRTPMGELNWIFTAVTDTIAWNVLPRDLFHKLFRQDLLVASLFRNFLLADRIMRSMHVTPMSYPALPPTHNHPMWAAWDLAVDTCVSQLPGIFAASPLLSVPSIPSVQSSLSIDEDGMPMPAPSSPMSTTPMSTTPMSATPYTDAPMDNYQFSSFFSAQLTDFEVWLRFGARSMLWNDAYYQQIFGIAPNPSSQDNISTLGKSLIPKQLPILLQVLLSQVHRLKALSLLGRFLDMGPWAVNLALAVGIFPYVVKLLSSNSPELKQILVFIWVKILALDKSCQVDLIKDNGHIYFVNILATKTQTLALSLYHLNQSYAPNQASQIDMKDALQLKTMCAFVLSVMVDKYQMGQSACLQYKNLLSICVAQLHEDDKHLRKWLLLLIGKLIQDFEPAQEEAFKSGIHEKLIVLLDDAVPEVRAAAIYALHCFLADCDRHASRVMAEVSIGKSMIKMVTDGSSMVRRECLCCFSTLIVRYSTWIQGTLLQGLLLPSQPQQSPSLGSTPPSNNNTPPTHSSSYDEQSIMHDEYDWNKTLFVMDMIRMVQYMTNDPSPDISKSANQIVLLLKHRHIPAAIQEESEQTFDRKSQKFLSKDYKRRSKSPVVTSPSTQTSSKNLPQALMNNLMKRSSSEPNFLNAQQDDSMMQQQQQPLPSYPESNYYELSVQWYSLPMLPENQQQLPYWNDLLGSSMNMIPDPATILVDVIQAPIPTTNSINSTTTTTNSTTTTTIPSMDPANMNPVNYNQLRKQRRYEQLIKEALGMYKTAGKKKLEEQIGFFGNEDDVVSKMKFHAFDPLLLVSDDHDGLTVWNWITGKKMNQFKCGNRLKGKISDFHLLNESYNGSAFASSLLLVVGTTGNVCIWKDYEIASETSTQPKLMTAFRAAPDLSWKLPYMTELPVILSQWQSYHGLLYLTGDKNMKIWDIDRETCIQTVQFDADFANSTLTSMTCDTSYLNHCTVGLGFHDGTIALYDKRASIGNKTFQCIAKFKEHKQPIINLHVQKINNYQLISGSASGDVKFWDTRFLDSSVKTFEAHKGCTALAIHDYAPVMASGSNNQFVKVFNTTGDTLSMIYYHDGFLGQRIGPISSLAFHPYKMILAAGSTDSIISIYSGDNTLVQRMKKK